MARCFSCTLATCLPPLGPLHRAVLDLLAEEIPRLEGLVPLTARAENRVVRAESPLLVSPGVDSEGAVREPIRAARIRAVKIRAARIPGGVIHAAAHGGTARTAVARVAVARVETGTRVANATIGQRSQLERRARVGGVLPSMARPVPPLASAYSNKRLRNDSAQRNAGSSPNARLVVTSRQRVTRASESKLVRPSIEADCPRSTDRTPEIG